MELVEVTNSSAISGHGYDPETQTLIVRFKHGGQSYRYSPVPAEEYEKLKGADSIGRHFREAIVTKYTGERVCTPV